MWKAMLLALAPSQDAERPYLEAALAAAHWLDSVAVEAPGGRAWPADPARSPAPGWTLYAGTPGVVLFHLELFAATGDERWLRAAHAGAGALEAWAQAEGGSGQAGLYTGSAGVAFALLEAGSSPGGERFSAAGLRLVDGLRGRTREVEGGGRSFGPVTDVIAGDAGVGFLLLATAETHDRTADLALAIELGRGLLARADETEHGLDWAMTPTYARRMPNFSHGTAGVAAYLAALDAASGEAEFGAAAARAAEHLEAIAVSEAGGFRVHHHTPDGEELFYLGWCHGPTGTARLFRALNRTSGGERWAGLDRACAQTLLAAGLPQARPDGYWNNVGVCCGAAGVADFLLDAHVRHGTVGALALARALTDDLLARGTRDDAGLRWEHAEHRVRPEYLSTQTGWMQGASGVGHWLLTLDAFDQGREVRVVLPDDR